ncbi:MAG: divalent metal cation transporter, partial [Candidatus Helarchaeota archaeon]|nr:divalent metal cation transporter [Candidatus Helarchaeota archaeon]
SLNDSFKKSRTFYILYILQLAVATVVILFPGVSLFKLAVATQVINAISLPLVFYFLIKLTSDKELMGEFANTKFQKYFAIICTVVIVIASAFTVVAVIRNL